MIGMKWILTLIVFGLTLFPVLGSDDCHHGKDSFQCVTYIKNYDADTVTFNIPGLHPLLGKKINIRVGGVDTPEMRTKNQCEKRKARNAKKLVANLLKHAKRIDLINVKRGKYFRLVADVIIDGKNLKDYILKNGLGYAYDGGTKKKMNWCRSEREIASENQ